MTSSAWYAMNGHRIPEGAMLTVPKFTGAVYMPPDCRASRELLAREIAELRVAILELAVQLNTGEVSDEALLVKIKSDRYLLDRLRLQK